MSSQVRGPSQYKAQPKILTPIDASMQLIDAIYNFRYPFLVIKDLQLYNKLAETPRSKVNTSFLFDCIVALP